MKLTEKLLKEMGYTRDGKYYFRFGTELCIEAETMEKQTLKTIISLVSDRSYNAGVRNGKVQKQIELWKVLGVKGEAKVHEWNPFTNKITITKGFLGDSELKECMVKLKEKADTYRVVSIDYVNQDVCLLVDPDRGNQEMFKFSDIERVWWRE